MLITIMIILPVYMVGVLHGVWVRKPPGIPKEIGRAGDLIAFFVTVAIFGYLWYLHGHLHTILTL